MWIVAPCRFPFLEHTLHFVTRYLNFYLGGAIYVWLDVLYYLNSPFDHYVYLSNILFELYTESHQTYRTIHRTSNNANTCTKCKASVKGSSPSHVSIVLSTTQPGLRQQCYEKPTPLWNPPPGKAHQRKQNTSTHTHIKKNFCCGRYKASQQRNDSKSQARSQRQSLLPTTCGRSFD